MKSSALTLALLAVQCMAAPVYAACNAPEDPAIPSGMEASGADMLKAKKAIEGYISAVEAYIDCGIPLTQQERATLHMTKIVDKFNLELRAYKEKG